MADVMQECWRASVPVQLRLADSEVTSVEHPPVLYFLVPRHSYLLSLLPKALPFVQHVLPPGKDTPWMEHNSLPLKWSVPAGVLYDLLAGEGELPWSLTVHFRGYPSSILPAFDGEAALRGALLNSLKEAAFVCRGSSIRVMEMSPGAQEDMYRSVAQQDLPLYRSVLQSLQLAPVARGSRQPAIPLRVYLRAGGRGYLSSYEGIAYTSRSVECQRPDGSLVTLGEAVLPLVAEYMGTSSGSGDVNGNGSTSGSAAPPSPAAARGSPSAARPAASPPGIPAVGSPAAAAGEAGDDAAAAGVDGSEAGEAGEAAAVGGREGGGDQGGTEEEPTAAQEPPGGSSPQGGSEADGVGQGPGSQAAGRAEGLVSQVLVCGVSPPLETPVAWVHANMHAADLFLYVVIHVNSR